MLLYQSDIEVLEKLTRTISVLKWVQKLPIIGRYLSSEDSVQYINQYANLRSKLLQAQADNSFVTIEPEDVPILRHVVTSALGGAGIVDKTFGDKSGATVVLEKIKCRLEREFSVGKIE